MPEGSAKGHVPLMRRSIMLSVQVVALVLVHMHAAVFTEVAVFQKKQIKNM